MWICLSRNHSKAMLGGSQRSSQYRVSGLTECTYGSEKWIIVQYISIFPIARRLPCESEDLTTYMEAMYIHVKQGICYGSPVYSYINQWFWGLIAVEYIRVDRTGVNAYSIRIKLQQTQNIAWVLLLQLSRMRGLYTQHYLISSLSDLVGTTYFGKASM